MKLAEHLAQARGRQAALAKQIGAHAPDVSQWARGKRPIPAEFCPAIEKATLRAVTCEEMRPDVDWSVLRSNRHRAIAQPVPTAQGEAA